MSVESMAIALHHSRSTGSARLILIGIANHDGDGGAWPSQATLAKYAGGITRARVKAATDKLIELGEITLQPNAGGSGTLREWERPHLYRFTLRCPSTCDRSAQHRDRTRHVMEIDPASDAIPGGGIEIPHQVSAGYPDQVSHAQQEPSSKPSIPKSKGNHLPDQCPSSPTGTHASTPTGWCQWGEHRIEAVTS